MNGAKLWGSCSVTRARQPRSKTGTRIRWLPDLEVFTDIDIPVDYYRDVLKRQAVVNAGVTVPPAQSGRREALRPRTFSMKTASPTISGSWPGTDALTEPVCWEAERRGRDRADKPEYKVKLNIACCFSNRHPPGGALPQLQLPGARRRPGKGHPPGLCLRRSTSICSENGKYTKDESKITFPDVQDCLILVSNNFSTQTSYENQTKKAITNKFIQDAMTEFLREQLQVYFIENPMRRRRSPARC